MINLCDYVNILQRRHQNFGEGIRLNNFGKKSAGHTKTHRRRGRIAWRHKGGGGVSLSAP